jgi:hypothetical protein
MLVRMQAAGTIPGDRIGFLDAPVTDRLTSRREER